MKKRFPPPFSARPSSGRQERAAVRGRRRSGGLPAAARARRTARRKGEKSGAAVLLFEISAAVSLGRPAPAETAGKGPRGFSAQEPFDPGLSPLFAALPAAPAPEGRMPPKRPAPARPEESGGQGEGALFSGTEKRKRKRPAAEKKGCPARGIHRQSGTGYFDFFRHSLHSPSCRERMPPHCGQV